MEKLKIKKTSIPRYPTYPRDLQMFDPLSQIHWGFILGFVLQLGTPFLAGLGFFRDKGGGLFLAVRIGVFFHN